MARAHDRGGMIHDIFKPFKYCLVCLIEFSGEKPSRTAKRKYCSNECRGIADGIFKKMHVDQYRGENNPAWKGDRATYHSFHRRVHELRGKACRCEHCGTTDPSLRYEWASKSKHYEDPGDYISLCRSCHCKYDHLSQGSANPSWNGGPLSKTCLICRRVFSVPRNRDKTAKYCSRICHVAARQS